jgi:AcrR family transcriptional regulator
MDAAQALFLAQGVGETTIEQVTLAAGVAKGTFYLYFSSKEDVLAGLGQRFAQGLLARVRAAVAAAPGEDWRAALAAWARACAGGYLDSIRLHDLAFFASPPANRDGRVRNVIVDHLGGLLEDGAQAGAWSIDDARLTAVFLFSGLHGMVDDAVIAAKGPKRARLLEAAERIALRAVGLPQGG